MLAVQGSRRIRQPAPALCCTLDAVILWQPRFSTPQPTRAALGQPKRVVRLPVLAGPHHRVLGAHI